MQCFSHDAVSEIVDLINIGKYYNCVLLLKCGNDARTDVSDVYMYPF